MTETHQPFTVADARSLARLAHAGQTDKLGVPYIEHVEAVAGGLVDYDLDVQVAAMLHDVVEDTDLTLDDLRDRGVSPRSLSAIKLVSRNLHPEATYLEGIRLVTSSTDATLVKISDNAHNSRPDRVRDLEAATGKAPNPRYAEARALLYAAAAIQDVVMILRRVAPPLLLDLPQEAVTVGNLEELLED